jgi:hypothetical protein
MRTPRRDPRALRASEVPGEPRLRAAERETRRPIAGAELGSCPPPARDLPADLVLFPRDRAGRRGDRAVAAMRSLRREISSLDGLPS